MGHSRSGSTVAHKGAAVQKSAVGAEVVKVSFGISRAWWEQIRDLGTKRRVSSQAVWHAAMQEYLAKQPELVEKREVA